MSNVRPRVPVSITDFLHARITEEEIRCATLLETTDLAPAVRRALSVALRSCRAKRQIIEVQPGFFPDDDDDEPSWELMALAYVYSDHPDWCEEWRP